MYTNMQIQDLQDTLNNNLEKIERELYNFKIPNRTDLKKFVKLILENNEFEFNGHLYKQVIGAPMGGILSPTCTDLHLASVLKIILERFHQRKSIKLHCQYRDDGFMVFSGTIAEIKEFFNIANEINPLLKFTFEISNSVMNYLDTDIFKGERFQNCGILDVKSHIKKNRNISISTT